MPQENDWCFPLKVLENDRLKLVPFEREKYAQPLYEGMRDHPEIWDCVPSGPYTSASDLITNLFEKKVDCIPGNILYSVLVKLQSTESQEDDEQLAGLVGFLNSSVLHATTEIQITILPPCQRTFVATNAVGLLLLYCLDPPSRGGLGLRRVQWQANSENKPSIRLAQRMLMTYEGTLRWHRALPGGKTEKAGNGVDVQRLRDAERYAENGEGYRPGRHSAMLSMCWDDWLVDGKREKVLEMMERRK